MHAKRLICAVMHSGESKISINVVTTQLQSNVVDCGVYALAYALAAGEDPSQVTSNQVAMRNNLLSS